MRLDIVRGWRLLLSQLSQLNYLDDADTDRGNQIVRVQKYAMLTCSLGVRIRMRTSTLITMQTYVLLEKSIVCERTFYYVWA